jgi:hypothetical protein
MSRPATTAEWNADRTAQLLDVTREGNKSSAVKLPSFNALRSEAKIIVDRKRFVWFSSPMNKTNTTTSAAREAGQMVTSVSEIKAGDTVTWVDGFGNSITEKVHVGRLTGTTRPLVVRGFADWISVQHLLNIHGALCLNAR